MDSPWVFVRAEWTVWHQLVWYGIMLLGIRGLLSLLSSPKREE